MLERIEERITSERASLHKAKDSRHGDGGRGKLSLSIAKTMTVPFPSPPEQTATAAVSGINGGLAALGQRREKTRALKQAMMQELQTGRIGLM